MRVWIDLTNSPHVPFFAGMARDLSRDHELVLTCRRLANTVELLDMEGFAYEIVGQHYGATRVKKSAGFAVRIFELYAHLRELRLDVAVSHSSFYSPVVASLLGIPSVYLNDNEHAAGNQIAFRFASTVMVPEHLALEKVYEQGARPGATIQYPGVKEGVYLWRLASGALERSKASRGRNPRVFVRPEPATAQYYSGRKNFLDDLFLELGHSVDFTLLPRSDEQADHYGGGTFPGVTVARHSIPMATIMQECDLFIGAGGTMTREAAVLGVPTISVYQDELLDVDRYLISKGFMVHAAEPTPSEVMERVQRGRERAADTVLLERGREADAMIKRAILAPTPFTAGG